MIASDYYCANSPIILDYPQCASVPRCMFPTMLFNQQLSHLTVADRCSSDKQRVLAFILQILQTSKCPSLIGTIFSVFLCVIILVLSQRWVHSNAVVRVYV